MPQKRCLDVTNDDLSIELEQRVLHLHWSVRKRIKNNLDNHNECFYRKVIDENKKKELSNENDDLIKILMNLPSEISAKPMPPRMPSKRIKIENISSMTTDATIADDQEIIFFLPWSIRNTIVDSLMKNHHVLSFDNSVSMDEKSKLIQQNYDLSHNLNDLRPKPIAEIQLDDDEEEVAELEWPNNSTVVDDKKDLLALMQLIKSNSQLSKTFESSLKPTKEKEFNVKVNVAQLRDEKVFYSDSFFLCDIPWLIKVTNKLTNGTIEMEEVIGVYLHLDSNEYNVDTIVEIKALDVNKAFKNNYTKAGSKGLPDFALMSQVDGEQIEISVYLKIVEYSKKSMIEI